MSKKNTVITDANEAVASVAFRLSETIAIYPITPSSPMAENCEEWAVKGKKNLWGITPSISQLQSEGGVAGSVHGALETGSLVTTFTASQGLLLMIPNLYKIAGELMSFVMHVSARALAHHGLSIFGDQTDVMACRQTGFAMLCSNNAQEAHDFAAIAHAATLECRVPFMHFFDGFRTSHEVNTYIPLSDDQLLKLVPYDKIIEMRSRAMSPDRPFIRGTAQNPDVYFQSWEARNPFYSKCVEAVAGCMKRFGEITGRNYSPYEYSGAPDAEKVIVIMGSGAETAEETAKYLNSKGEKVGVLKVRMFRPFSVKMFVDALPKTAKKITVLDRTKELGALGEPLYLDVCSSIAEARNSGLLPRSFDPVVVGGRYGLGSKDFIPAMVKGVYDNMSKDEPMNHFSVGIVDDVSGTSIPYPENFDLEGDDVLRAVFYGIGSDGTVGANKNTIKIIGNETDNFAQAYFVYDSKKSGGLTVSHLRFGPNPIRAPYLIRNAQFVACHSFPFMEKLRVLDCAAEGATFLLNSIYDENTVWDKLNSDVQRTIIEKKLKFYVIDAYDVAKKVGMGGRTNTIMQTCYFAISGVLPRDEAIAKIKASIEKTYSKKGPQVVQKNFAAVDASVENLKEVKVPDRVTAPSGYPPAVPENAPDFVKNVISVMMMDQGDKLPVSAMPIDGTWPSATTQWEKRNIALAVPSWNPELCIQCAKCATICPHAAIRAKFYPDSELKDAPETFKRTAFKSKADPNCSFTIQVAVEDCTGCGLCAQICPGKSRTQEGVKALTMVPQEPVRESEKKNFEFFMKLPNPDRSKLGLLVRDVQFRQPLFEFSGACAGCGETPYVKMLTQLFGDRLYIANATGCSSIYGGNLPTTPYCMNPEGRGPSWANSLFEDNAEFGFGYRISLDKKREIGVDLLKRMSSKLGDDFVKELIESDQSGEAGVSAQRKRVEALKSKLAGDSSFEAKALLSLANDLVDKSVWIVGGDGWAYDIGYGGVDHVLASGKNVNILVLDTEVYSNTGGQMSKATSLGAVAKFASKGKATPKKDLGMLAINYGNVYVAQVSMGAKDTQVIQAMTEADSYNGPSLVIAYSHCISHGYNLINGPEQQRKAVESAYWPLYRYDPRKIGKENPFKLDSRDPKISVAEYMAAENRFNILKRSDPERAELLAKEEQEFVNARWAKYKYMAAAPVSDLKQPE